MKSEGTFGVRWLEFNRQDQLVMKQKDFKTKNAADKFIEKLKEKDNFHSIYSRSFQ